ncbi:SGNH/GDSL hydrolase family protein [Actinosynnema sp. NPDC020468]|uniref:SGNH/GDSL hydrolase family protein n=1 Tax=Actinosynnema sp. NPDC020468 TaxID=3154488 RepID=UPI0033D2FECE
MVRSLVVLGDSTTVGVGDPVSGGWRGVGRLLAAAFAGARYTNPSFPGARVADVRRKQLPAALAQVPDAAVVLVGMNDTLRSDFDAVRLHEDLDAIVGELVAAGSAVVTVRFHDHSRVFRLPGALRRALKGRIEELNAVVDAVVKRHGAGCVDLDLMEGAYELDTWAVDRLHPSELGHRRLALAFANRLADQGCAVTEPVSLVCTGGLRITPLHHVAWLLIKGIPWVWRRSRDLLPYAIAIFYRAWIGRPETRRALMLDDEAVATADLGDHRLSIETP